MNPQMEDARSVLANWSRLVVRTIFSAGRRKSPAGRGCYIREMRDFRLAVTVGHWNAPGGSGVQSAKFSPRPSLGGRGNSQAIPGWFAVWFAIERSVLQSRMYLN